MTVRLTILTWRHSRDPEGWHHDPPEILLFDTRAGADAYVMREKRILEGVNEYRGRLGRLPYRTTFDIEEIDA